MRAVGGPRPEVGHAPRVLPRPASARAGRVAHDHLSPGAIAARFRVGESTVRGWLRRVRATGSLVPEPHSGGMPPKVDAAGAPVLLALGDAENARTLAELAAAYGAETGRALSLRAVRRACMRLDVRRTKKEPGTCRAGAP